MAELKGVGPSIARRLARLGVERCADLLFLLPLRYEDRTQVRALGSLRAGEKVLAEGAVELAEVVFRRRRSLLCRIADGTGRVTLRFFYFSRAQQESLLRGARLRCFGEVRAGPLGLEMVHPEYRLLGAEPGPAETTLTPIYPSTEGLQQQRLRGLVQQALATLDLAALEDHLVDLLPRSWPSIGAALVFLHAPPQGAELAQLAAGRHPCQRRLALEELIAQRLSLKQAGRALQRDLGWPLSDTRRHLEPLRRGLGFELTRAQARAVREVVADLGRSRPMHRLLQGDVGSGKTVVAAFAAALAASSGHQTAVMAPTELLAEQHFVNLERWLRPLGVRVAALSGSMSRAARTRALAEIGEARAEVVVGTHALFQESVSFRHLALVIVDEQHRFGVDQRLELRRKGEDQRYLPHQLVMTATPIPRTLAMTAYADLDCSVIDELPPGRRPVRTSVMPESRRARLVERVAQHCRRGQQVYWVCPLIEESELVDSQAAEEIARGLTAALPEIPIGLIHGRMRPAEKERVMRAFKDGSVGLLVATTVIEVGVDVPNATLMVVENSERMGLAQLHQLRGRVGRGHEASSCVLLYRPPLSLLAQERLRVMRRTTDGFEIAQKDLELRGPGEVLGTRQTGALELRVADLLRDADLLPTVIELSEALLKRHPERVDALIRRWSRGAQDYGKV